MHVLLEAVVKVLATQMSVSASSDHFEFSALQLYNAHVKCSATEVEDKDVFLYIIPKLGTIGDGSSGRLINECLDSEACDFCCVNSRLSLQKVEACRHRDYCGFARTIFAKIFVSNAYQLCENLRGDIFGFEMSNLILIGDLNEWFTTAAVDNCERP